MNKQKTDERENIPSSWKKNVTRITSDLAGSCLLQSVLFAQRWLNYYFWYHLGPCASKGFLSKPSSGSGQDLSSILHALQQGWWGTGARCNFCSEAPLLHRNLHESYKHTLCVQISKSYLLGICQGEGLWLQACFNCWFKALNLSFSKSLLNYPCLLL